VTIQEVTSPQTLSQWIRDRFGFTSREARVASHLTRRRSNAEIARALRISPHTARRHTEKVMTKLNVHRRIEVRMKILAAIDSLERRSGHGRQQAAAAAVRSRASSELTASVPSMHPPR
jgi:DNA-binding CsgD family transcriptional regulator